jgi:hypothetical protein
MIKQIICIFFLFINLITIYPDEQNLKKPNELEIFKPENYNQKSMTNPRYPKYYPIGWSKDGKYSYIDITSGGGRAEYIYSFVITSLIDDKILFSIESEGEGNDSFDDFWKKNIAVIKNKLNEFKIISPDKFNLSQFPITFDGDKISCLIEKKITGTDDMERDIGNSTVIVESVKYGKKIILKKDDLSILVTGYLKSPFENRIIVLFSSISPGWEGPPDEIRIISTGCHLTKRFVK